MRASLTPRRHTAGAVSFWNQTNWARPTSLATTAANLQVPFTTSAGLTSAITNMSAGQYIYYNGSGVLQITNTSLNTLVIASKSPSTAVTIDLGTKASTGPTNWGATTSANYVQIVNGTSTTGGTCMWLHDISNLNIYGGEFTGNQHTSMGIYFQGTSSNVYLMDFVVHDVAGDGLRMIPSAPSGVSSINGCTVRGEVYNWAMNPAIDDHPDKGSGLHAFQTWDSANGSSMSNNTLAVYGHDSLAAGATSFGTVWPEGGGGSVLEHGSSTGGTSSGNTIYALGVNGNMVPDGTNPGSSTKQTGTNVINAWGATATSGLTFGWIEGQSMTGAVFHGDRTSGGFATNAIVVNHGRHTSTNLSTPSGSGNIAVPYETITNVTYNDCT